MSKTFQLMPPTPVYIKLFFFHCLNPEGVKSGAEIPHLEERGPYTYIEYRRKIKISKIDEFGQNHVR
jgi:hypothetical protein